MNQIKLYISRLFLLTFCLFYSNVINAYDFTVNGLCYNILTYDTVELTWKGINDPYIGDIVVPDNVSYNGKTYKVVQIDDHAFVIVSSTDKSGKATGGNYNDRITSVKLPSTLLSIGEVAFYGCRSLTSISIPNSVTTIGHSAFRHCSGLSSITIPSSVTSIGLVAFTGCSSLTSIKVESRNTKYDSRNSCNALIETETNNLIAGCKNTTIPNSVTTIDQSAFYNCSGLTSITIPSSVTSIGISAFDGCSGLTSVTIPNSVTNIGNWAFDGCSGLTSVTIPNSVTNIGSNAFGFCYNLALVKSYIENPYNLDYVFQSISPSAKLEVPKGTKSKYQVLSGWANYFKEIVEMDAAPTTYMLSITASGNGSVSYGGSTIRGKTSSFTVNAGSSATITFSPDNGYRIKSVKVNNTTVSVSNNQYTISSINANTTVEVEFEAIPITTCTLSIKVLGSGSVSYGSEVIRNETKNYTVNMGTSVTVFFNADAGSNLKSLKVNGMSVSGSVYFTTTVNDNTTIEVEYEEVLTAFSAEDVNYTVVSVDEKTIRLASGSYGTILEVPAKVSYQDAEWTVTGIDNGALANNPDLAAIVWNPDVAFTEQVSNPNLLLYVNQTQFAPSSIKNVVVNGNATSITLTDAASGNNFHCPQAFTAQKISYTHNYNMDTGIGEAKGWETIALPFDVQKVTHQSKGEIVSFANWKSGDTKRPFWLMQLSSSGWTMAESIKAYTPYIISMPNNPEYKSGFLLNGRVTFSAENVNVPQTENLTIANYSDRTFIPIFTRQEKSNGVYALNVNNDIERNTNGATEGSTFVSGLRPVHPFEAYMTSTSSARSFGIDEGMATGIIELIWALSDGVDRIYNLNGQLIKIEEGRSLDEVIKDLPAGVYIVNGKKLIIK